MWGIACNGLVKLLSQGVQQGFGSTCHNGDGGPLQANTALCWAVGLQARGALHGADGLPNPPSADGHESHHSCVHLGDGVGGAHLSE